MKKIQEYEKDLTSIRSMMERSVKFLSLSGLSGVLAGLYAIAGAAAAFYILENDFASYSSYDTLRDASGIVVKLLIIAILVLGASLATGFWMSHRKAKRLNISLWTPASKRLVIDLAIPLATGGILILILLSKGFYGVVAPLSLIFYGLALLQASKHTYDEVHYLGLCEIAIGLTAALLPGYSLIFWTFGFGILHIIYGSVMYFKYDK